MTTFLRRLKCRFYRHAGGYYILGLPFCMRCLTFTDEPTYYSSPSLEWLQECRAHGWTDEQLCAIFGTWRRMLF